MVKTKASTAISIRLEDYYSTGLEIVQRQKAEMGLVGLKRTDLFREALTAYFREQSVTPKQIQAELEKKRP